MKTKHLAIIICCISSLLIGCTPMPNDDTIYISGQYVTVDENGNTIPFEHKVKCSLEVTYNSQVSYGMSTYRQTIPLYSEEDGSFVYEVKNVGSYRARLNTTYVDGDTLRYRNDTIIICSYGKPQKDVILPLKASHSFNPLLFPLRIVTSDTITFSINHDALTLIEIGVIIIGEDGKSIKRDDGLLELKVLWRFEVDNKQSFTFTLENSESEIAEGQRSVRLLLRYTTKNYGSYQTPFSLYRE